MLRRHFVDAIGFSGPGQLAGAGVELPGTDARGFGHRARYAADLRDRGSARRQRDYHGFDCRNVVGVQGKKARLYDYWRRDARRNSAASSERS